MNLWRIFKNRKGILGINERNLNYVKKYNSARAYKIADNKLLTKQALEKADIPTPKLIGVINNYKELNEFDWEKLPKSFVVKPVSGLKGGGIEIFYNRDKDGNWIRADGSRFSLEQIRNHAADIVDGSFSLHNQPDQVFFEERVRMHKNFQYYSFKGVPDVRIIIFKQVPIMAMLRLPTKESGGKGNLDLGAIGTGIDISSGVTTSGVYGKSKIIEVIPGNNLPVSGLKIPYWNKILEHAVNAQNATGVDFAGIDFLVDRDKGPMIIEVNARPGLSIQIANMDGLRWRLRKSKGLKIKSTARAVRIAKDLFGGDIEEDIERISGKNLIGLYEEVTVFPHPEFIDPINQRIKEIESGLSDVDNLDGANLANGVDAAANNETRRSEKPEVAVNELSNVEESINSQLLSKSEAKSLVKKEKRAQLKSRGQIFITKAKIDTGADSTSIDALALSAMGYDKLINYYLEFRKRVGIPDEVPESVNGAKMADEYTAQIQKELGSNRLGIISIRSSHGRSFRLYAEISLKLGDIIYTTSANVYNRSKLSYRVIIGRKSLSKFLIEPSKLN